MEFYNNRISIEMWLTIISIIIGVETGANLVRGSQAGGVHPLAGPPAPLLLLPITRRPLRPFAPTHGFCATNNNDYRLLNSMEFLKDLYRDL